MKSTALMLGLNTFPERKAISSGSAITTVIANIRKKSIRNARVLFLNEASGSRVPFLFTSATSAQDSTSLTTLKALSPVLLSLYLPVDVCSMKTERDRR